MRFGETGLSGRLEGWSSGIVPIFECLIRLRRSDRNTGSITSPAAFWRRIHGCQEVNNIEVPLAARANLVAP
ncbi:hypothetical protein N7450_007055 [Penicillium hetheringtonii]|uniref:Uncharacterized protein n=1 Tax=Penicillium hetheringtonii TaxID=911720 RepID=A0AAD6DGW6_9EURO|nr:hypothetical protein N7450_007055 [Penicillium hetheringtonii]